MTKNARICPPLALFALVGTMVLWLPACASNSSDDSASRSKGADNAAPLAGKSIDGEGQNIAIMGGELPADAKPYVVEVESPDATVGAQGQVKISVVPSETWHVNLEYPTKLHVEAPAGVELVKAEQSKGDALALTEEGCEFGVAYTANEAGTKPFSAEINFAVCQDTACVPKSETVTFEVAVK